ncbi:MAG: hypothetical protein RMY64_12330, partial [Nostoc sp. DedQUE08]|nr:hypothetical protein [Nostoc sp. DedQUE08]
CLRCLIELKMDKVELRGCLRSIKYFVRSPLAPLEKWGKLLKVPLFKGDLGGSTSLEYNTKKFSDIL